MDKSKVGQISGFPEWLPEDRDTELKWLDAIRAVYESYGYASIETRSVEPTSVLLKQGDTDHEIYGIHRLASDKQSHDEANLALHYDLTVPFARYTAQNLNSLTFPFKRFQTQKVWRGERPQGGRFREFYQCDIDVVDRDKVSLFYDYEVAAAALEALSALQLGNLTLKLNNRKILEGFYKGLGIEDTANTMRIVDKIDKITPKGVSEMLRAEVGLSDDAIEKCIALSGIKGSATNIALVIGDLGVHHPLLEEGLDELVGLYENLQDIPKNSRVELDLSVTRGLAYYTGNVFETELDVKGANMSICSGGRYENLATDLSNVKLPGVGISIGLSRIMAIMKGADLLPKGRPTPTEVMVAYTPGITQQMQIAASRTLRRQGLKVEVYPGPTKLDKQMKYADHKKIRFVYFCGSEGREDQVKDMDSGAQTSLANSRLMGLGLE